MEPDGKLRMVLANRPRSIGPIDKGIPFGYPGGTRPGISLVDPDGRPRIRLQVDSPPYSGSTSTAVP